MQPHTVFDVLAYSIGFRMFLWQRRRLGDTIDGPARWSVVAAAVFGAAIGSKIFFWLEDPSETLAHWNDPVFLLGGKTIVGALIGGLVGVELEKHWAGLTRRTGDLFAMPLAAGIVVGRIGCFLSGLADRTYGTPSRLPWAVDFGDGIPRHPTQLYESAVMAVAALVLGRLTWRHAPRGRRLQVVHGDLLLVAPGGRCAEAGTGDPPLDVVAPVGVSCGSRLLRP